ncbi:replication fork protection component Swi3-domain-containing protein [Pilobolus umbonatus]|nr:replication fork protection component Swi3-domain-containing protein [Pilobolus umbonatus]
MNYDDVFLDEIDKSTKAMVDTPKKEEKKATAKRIVKKKLNEELLLQAHGLPRLRSQARFLSFKGRNWERHDLHKLMNYYRQWANDLYPSLKLRDFAARVPKVASTKTIKSVIAEWQKEEIEEKRAKRAARRKEVDDDEYQARIHQSVFPDFVDNQKDNAVPVQAPTTPILDTPNPLQPNSDKPVRNRVTFDSSVIDKPTLERTLLTAKDSGSPISKTTPSVTKSSSGKTPSTNYKSTSKKTYSSKPIFSSVKPLTYDEESSDDDAPLFVTSRKVIEEDSSDRKQKQTAESVRRASALALLAEKRRKKQNVDPDTTF